MDRKVMDECTRCGRLRQIYAVGMCSKCYYGQYREANRETIRKTARESYHRNKELHHQRQRRYRERLAKGLVKKP